MDLSWSHRFKTDAPTLVKDLRKDVKKHMDFITANICKFDNVSHALSEGENTLGAIICRTCRKAVESKRREIHSKNQTVQKKKKRQKLSPERQQILNEITYNFIKLERSENEDEGEEYCTEGQYYREEMLEMESMYKNMLYDKQDEMAEIENKYKKEIQDKETELKKLANDKDELKKEVDSMSNKLQSYGKMETELCELKREKERLKEDLDNAGNSIKKLKRELGQKEEDIKRYRPSSTGYRTRWFTSGQDGEISRLKVELDSRDKELQTAKTENENLKTEKNEVIGRLEEEQRSLREAREELGKKCGELKAMKSLEAFEKAKRKQTVLGLWKEHSGIGKTMVDMITKELMRSVGGQLGRNNIDLTIQPCKTTSDISGGPLLVLCLNMSRVSANIQDSIGGIEGDKTNVFVLVLHHASKDNLASLTPTSLRVIGSELRTLGGIIDMAFSSDSGLYECDLNNNAAEQITSIMMRYNEKQEAYDKIHEEKEQCMREVSQLQAERQTLQDQKDSLNITVKDLSSTLKAKEQNIGKLTSELGSWKDAMHKEQERLRSELDRISQENDQIQKKYDNLTLELSQLDQTNSEQRNQITHLAEKQEAYDKSHQEKEQCMREISQLQRERQTLQDRTDSLNRAVEELSSTLNAKEQNIEILTGELDETQEAYNKIQDEKEQCMREVSQLQTERKTLHELTDSLNMTVGDLSSALKAKEQNIDKLTGELAKKNDEISNLTADLEECRRQKRKVVEETHNKLDKIQKENENDVEQILKLQTVNQTFQDQRDTSGKTNEEIASNIECQQQEMERFKNEREKIQKETDRHATDISEIDQEKQTLQGQTYSLTKTIKEMASVIETQQKEVETLKKSFDESQTELEEVQIENEKNAKDKFQLQSERKSMMDKLFSIKYGMDEMSSTTEGLQQDIAAFLTELVKGDGKPSYEESRRFKRKVVVMRLLCTSRSGLGKIMVDMVTKELTRQLGGRQDLRKFEISIVLPNTSKGVSKGPLFVVCLNTMVLKHVPDALEGPKGGRDVYLLVLHQTTRENLSTLRPDSLRNTGSELRQLGGVIDMVFSSESGLFECNINNTAFEQITAVLKKY